MWVLLVTNARSGDGAAAQVASRLRAHGCQVRTCVVHEVSAAAAQETRRVVVAGGDGSLGPAAEAAVAAGVPLAVVPVGTANDFARAAGLPLDVDAACALAADPAAPTAPFELARMDGRPFLNAASAGLAVIAAREAAPLKSRLGVLAYAAGALRAGLTHRPQRSRVRVDGKEVFDGPAWQLVVAATGHFGGGSSTGGTQRTDHELDVVVVPGGSRLALVRRAAGMRAGRLHAQDDVVHVRGARVTVQGPRAYNVDGEICDCGDTSEFTVDDRLVDVVVARRP